MSHDEVVQEVVKSWVATKSVVMIAHQVECVLVNANVFLLWLAMDCVVPESVLKAQKYTVKASESG
jgi:hypothetical protein